MNRLKTFYSADYAPEHARTFSRLAVASSYLQACDLVDIEEPPVLDPGLLNGLHAPSYLEAFHTGENPLASSSGLRWTPGIRDAVYAMLSGQLAAVAHAQTHGIALNLACGFHHAVYERGSGYCALNGLAFVAQQMRSLRVFVLDCDEHGGNGTEEFIARLPNLSQATIFGTRFGCFGSKRSYTYHVPADSDGSEYRRALDSAFQIIRSDRPDLLLYQAGADCHIDDPKSRARLTTEVMFERDRLVFRLARDLSIPIVVVVAGGYQSSDVVARLNANSVRAALGVFGESALAPQQGISTA